MQKNQTKEKLKAGETVFGAFVRYPDPALIEFLGYQGWDFLVFDAFLHRFLSILEQFGAKFSSDLRKFCIRTNFRNLQCDFFENVHI